jgi:hypothetical protein
MSQAGPIEVRMPAQIGELHLLDRVDYEDAYCAETRIERTPEQWMRAIVEGAPRWFQRAWPAILGTLGGLQFGPLDAPDHVLGWQILDQQPDRFVIGLESSRGFRVRLVTLVPPGQAIFATQLELGTTHARRLWSVVRPAHRFFAPYLLGRAAQP